MKNLNRAVTFLLIFLFLGNFYSTGQGAGSSFQPPKVLGPAFLRADSLWVDSVMNRMNLEEKIAQMIMIPAYSDRDAAHTEEIRKLIRKYKVGGIIFFQGGPVRQAMMTNIFQQESEVPLLIAIDGEWGLGMRLDSVISYPRQMMLGAIRDNALVYNMGRDIALQMKRLGISVNFAPVADINNNPANPVIGTRSFGENRENVSLKSSAYMKGMQDQGLLVSAKHFPGHGDTDTDSHKALPLIPFDRKRLDSLELFPFRYLIDEGLSGIMVAHLGVPVLDDRADRPSTLSEKVIDTLLVNDLGFKGLIYTDALSMKGASNYLEPGELEAEAVRAGNDILLMPADIQAAIQTIKREVRKGSIPEEEINRHVRKILLAKKWAGLDKKKPVETRDLVRDLNSRNYEVNRKRLIENSLTLVRNRANLLPLKRLENIQLATVAIGDHPGNGFDLTSDLYLTGDHYALPATPDPKAVDQLIDRLQRYNTVVVNVFGISTSASKSYGIGDETLRFLASLDSAAQIILNFYGYPYALKRLGEVPRVDALLVCYNDNETTRSYAAQALFGGLALSGRLPVSAGTLYPEGTGLVTRVNRFKYTDPEDAGMNFDTLQRIDRIVEEAIAAKAIPGCQVFVARNGRVVWNKAYGYKTYLNREAVTTDDLYDLASLTKISATIPALMRLSDEGRFKETLKLEDYLPWLDTTNKGSLLITDILTHQAGLLPWIPFYYTTIEPLDSSEALLSTKFSSVYSLQIGAKVYANRNVAYRNGYYSRSFKPAFSIQVAEGLYLRSDFRDSILYRIAVSELKEPVYRYSDLGYYLFQQLIEQQTDTLLYPFAYYNFYAPLGAGTLGYLPLGRFPSSQIVPTENDMFFRRQLLRGYVHDPGAAMMGGVCGHAGLFSNANDLGKMMQMILNYGSYGGDRYIDSATVVRYTSCVNCNNGNRRALGFDRPAPEKDTGPACNSASPSSYGHTGFTGTMAWMDPENGLLYIFLSNRIHPNQANNTLTDLNIRTRIQQVLYNSVGN